MSLTNCPCCHVVHGVLTGTHKEPSAAVKMYQCHECQSNWQVVTFEDGKASIGLVTPSAAMTRDGNGKAKKAMQKKAKQGAANAKARHKAGAV